MEFSADYEAQTDALVELFGATFAASEGADEGKLIAGLVRDIFRTTRAGDMFVFSAWVDAQLAGCTIYSRLSFEQDDRTAFLLAPVAVKTDKQGQGIGQALLRHGLKELREIGVDVAVTYGDPDYYSKVGFRQVSEQQLPAPQKLQHPHGWLAQSLSGDELAPFVGPSRCIKALNDPVYW